MLRVLHELTSLAPVLELTMIFRERLITTSGGDGACSVATVIELMERTTASHLHQLMGLAGQAVGERWGGVGVIKQMQMQTQHIHLH